MSNYNKEYFIKVLSTTKNLSDIETIRETPNHMLFICKDDLEYKLYLGIVGEPEPYNLNQNLH